MEVQTLAGHSWPVCPWPLALPEASRGSVLGSEFGAPRAGGGRGGNKGPSVDLALCCVMGQVRPTLGQQSAIHTSHSHQLAGGTLGKCTVSPSYK